MMNCLICGIGGQGTVLASKLIAHAAIAAGYSVRTAETIGMAQRGGSVFSHVRIGEDIASPLIPIGCADALLAFEPAEAVRALPFLKKGGFVLVCDRAQKPVSGTLQGGSYSAEDMITYLQRVTPRVRVFEAQRYFAAGGTPKTLNTALLGAASACGIFPFEPETLLDALKTVLPEKYFEINYQSFELGRSFCDE